MLESSVYSYLLTYSGLTALISNRIYPIVLPTPPTYPSITYQKISGTDELVMGRDDGISECRIQYDCWASSYGSAKTVAAQVKKALQNYIGIMNGTTTHCIQLVNEMDSYTSNVFRTTLEFEFQYQE
jgi:hypothetical protein